MSSAIFEMTTPSEIPPSRQESERLQQHRYPHSQPIDMFIETLHPDDEASRFIVSYINPTALSNRTFDALETEQKILKRGMHRHDYFELVYVMRGEMYQKIENQRHLYPEGSLCLLNRNVRHTEEFGTDYRAIFISLPPPMISRLVSAAESAFFPAEKDLLPEKISDFFSHDSGEYGSSVREYIDFIPTEDCRTRGEVYALFDSLVRCFLYPLRGSSMEVEMLLLKIFNAIAQKSDFRTVPVNIGTHTEAALFDKITDLLESSYGRISRSELEHRLNYSGNYLNRIVKKYTDLNISRYALSIAMREAKKLLAETSLPVADIAAKLSFTNRSHFYRLFEDAYGTTPAEYRRSIKKSSNFR